MSSESESMGDRIERRIASENPSDTNFLVPFLKVVVLGLSTVFGWQAAVLTGYVLIGDSLGVRVGNGRGLSTWFYGLLLWLPMLVLDMAGLSEGDA